MFKYSYALEKFNRAIYTLATGREDVRRRLLHVFRGELMMIRQEHLPERCRDDFQWIEKTITKFDESSKGQKEYFQTPNGRYDHLIPGRIEATLRRIKNSTGEKIAEKIYGIWSVLNNDFSEK